MDNQTEKFVFMLFLLLYLSALLGNMAIMIVVICEPRLHTPMYFFLCNLSCLDIFFSTVTVPKMLAGFLSGHQDISYTGCLSQLHFSYFAGTSEALLLAVMAYDRFVAICYPLRYTLIMSPRACLQLAAGTWTTGFLHALMHTVMTSRLHFCGPNHIQHYFCDIKPVVKLACNSSQLNLTLLNIITGSLAIGPFVFILFSYLYIFSFLRLKVQSKEGRRKAFSTCISHLTVVALFYVPVIFNYVPPSLGNSPRWTMIATLMYNVVTPVLNPLIYTLRNVEVKRALKTVGSRWRDKGSSYVCVPHHSTFVSWSRDSHVPGSALCEQFPGCMAAMDLIDAKSPTTLPWKTKNKEHNCTLTGPSTTPTDHGSVLTTHSLRTKIPAPPELCQAPQPAALNHPGPRTVTRPLPQSLPYSLQNTMSDFTDVFEKKAEETLPLYDTYDCHIDLIPRKEVPCHPELAALKEYLKDNLAQWFIYLSYWLLMQEEGRKTTVLYRLQEA
ncbi:olfactory receptor 12D1-like [Apteryx mantelli]|uniref:Olfactory receptor 12D1-like n=1 Tax=Apteryx mantelli TaxID=2696672 RepID=A0ABM4G8C9_9AVES